MNDSSSVEGTQKMQPERRDPAMLLALWTPLGGPTEVLGMHLFLLLKVADWSYLPPLGE